MTRVLPGVIAAVVGPKEAPMDRPFADMIRHRRKARSVSLGDLAATMGWTVVYLSALERGIAPPPIDEQTISALAATLEIDLTPLREAAAAQAGCSSSPREAHREAVISAAVAFVAAVRGDAAVPLGQALRKLVEAVEALNGGQHGPTSD